MGKPKIYKYEELPNKINLTSRCIDITNQRFGRLTALFPCGKATDGSIQWACKCDCGERYIITTTSNLRKGRNKSCGSQEDNIYLMKTQQEKLHNELISKTFNNLEVLDFSHKIDKKIYMKCKCLLCGTILSVRKDSIINGHTTSCGCIKSKGEEKIKYLLNNKNILFKTEVSFQKLKDKNKLRFDFGIYDNNKNLLGLIEFQGKQHYYAEEKGWNSLEHLEYTQNHDLLKENFCKENNIRLYYITYQDNIEEKLKEILDELYGK